MSNRGQPKTSHFVKTSIVFKVKQYQKRYNESGRKAWLRLTKHRAFPELMAEHFKNDNRNGSARALIQKPWVR